MYNWKPREHGKAQKSHLKKKNKKRIEARTPSFMADVVLLVKYLNEVWRDGSLAKSTQVRLLPPTGQFTVITIPVPGALVLSSGLCRH